MTANYSSKREIRTAMEVTGRPYVEIARLADAFSQVLNDQPWLSRNGMGLSRTSGATVEEQMAAFVQYRHELRDSLATVAEVYFWLNANIRAIRTPTRGSYGLKHVAERAIGHYVSNGELIAAALIAGYPMREQRSLNPLFGMRKIDLDKAIAAGPR
jgi:hypothetical protein